MKKQSFFCNDLPSLKKDLERHSDKEKELLLKMNKADKEGDERIRLVYQNFLSKLRASKAMLTQQLGKSK